MKRLVLVALLLLTVPARADTKLEVFAAASLREAFDSIAQAFELSHPGVEVRVQYAGTPQLAAQIEQGARADVFAAADDRAMSRLVSKGFTAAPPQPFARNTLVLVVPRSNPGAIHAVKDLARPGVKLLVGAESVPVGAYTRLALASLDADLGPGFARRVLANVVSEEENVRAIVNKVALGEADAGFVYRTDVTPGVEGRLRRLDLPASVRVVARYPIAALNGPQEALARRFVEFVRSKEGQRLLARERFLPAS